MNKYLSAAELAQLNILSLPKTPKGISDKAKRECWPSRKRAQRGGGMEYQVAGLPETIQTAVRERQAEQLLAQSQPAAECGQSQTACGGAADGAVGFAD